MDANTIAEIYDLIHNVCFDDVEACVHRVNQMIESGKITYGDIVNITHKAYKHRLLSQHAAIDEFLKLLFAEKKRLLLNEIKRKVGVFFSSEKDNDKSGAQFINSDVVYRPLIFFAVSSGFVDDQPESICYQNYVKMWNKEFSENLIAKIIVNDDIDNFIKYDLDSKACVNSPSPYKIGPNVPLLCFAARCGAVRIFKNLVITSKSIPRESIGYAVNSGSLEILRILLNEIGSANYNTILGAAIEFHHTDIVRWVYEGDNTAFCQSAKAWESPENLPYMRMELEMRAPSQHRFKRSLHRIIKWNQCDLIDPMLKCECCCYQYYSNVFDRNSFNFLFEYAKTNSSNETIVALQKNHPFVPILFDYADQKKDVELFEELLVAFNAPPISPSFCGEKFTMSEIFNFSIMHSEVGKNFVVMLILKQDAIADGFSIPPSFPIENALPMVYAATFCGVFDVPIEKAKEFSPRFGRDDAYKQLINIPKNKLVILRHAVADYLVLREEIEFLEAFIKIRSNSTERQEIAALAISKHADASFNALTKWYPKLAKKEKIIKAIAKNNNISAAKRIKEFDAKITFRDRKLFGKCVSYNAVDVLDILFEWTDVSKRFAKEYLKENKEIMKHEIKEYLQKNVKGSSD